MDIISLSPAAINKLTDLLDASKSEKLRIFVQGGGCSGFSYGFAIAESIEEDDFMVTVNGVTVIVDSISSQYLQGSTVDYKEDLMNSSFVIQNPNANTSCGCGSSFSV